MGFVVVDTEEIRLESDGHGLAECEAGPEGIGESWTPCRGDKGHIVNITACLSEELGGQGQEILEMLPGGKFRDDASILLMDCGLGRDQLSDENSITDQGHTGVITGGFDAQNQSPVFL